MKLIFRIFKTHFSHFSNIFQTVSTAEVKNFGGAAENGNLANSRMEDSKSLVSPFLTCSKFSLESVAESGWRKLKI